MCYKSLGTCAYILHHIHSFNNAPISHDFHMICHMLYRALGRLDHGQAFAMFDLS